MKDDSAEIMHIFNCYTKLRVVSIMYNQSLGISFLPFFKTTLGISFVATLFTVVKLFFLKNVFIIVMNSVCVVVITIVLMILTNLCAQLHEQSLQLFQDMVAKKCSGKRVQKLLRSYKILGVEVGNYYQIHRITPITLLAMVSSATMNLLISVDINF